MYTYSNGILKGKNNLIKVFKQIALYYTDYHISIKRYLLITNKIGIFRNKKLHHIKVIMAINQLTLVYLNNTRLYRTLKFERRK